MAPRFLPAALLVSIAGLFAPTLEGQNLLQNAHFDTDVSGWSIFCAPPECSTMSWSSLDGAGSPSSGSARVTTVFGGPEQDISPVFEGIDYDFGASVRRAAEGGASARVIVSWLASTLEGGRCGGGVLRADTTPWGGTSPDTWEDVSATTTAPPGARCAIVQLIVASQPQLPGSAHFDDVFFTRHGTTGSFYTATPCRIVDTRNPDGPFGGPAFQPLNIRVFAIPGSCGIPAEATAIAANLTTTNTTGGGHFLAYPTGISQPTASNLNFRARQTRANNATIALGVAGQITVFCALPFGSTADFILDIAGYFQ